MGASALDPASQAVDLTGKTVGSYRLVSLLGSGGMGAVYLGEHATIGSKVAIKVLHPLFAKQQDVIERFFNEARAVNVVQHQSIVAVHDYGKNDQVGAYLVMEYLAGESLEDRLARVGRLTPRKAATLVRKIASPLAAAHDAGIIHRDLKPANIMLMPDADHPGEERIKLLDFGIAKLTESAGLGPSKTQTGMLLGTPLYMSPEQCSGDGEIDPRADVYALGVIAYEMLCGRPPFFEGNYGTIIAHHILKEPPPLRGLVPDIPDGVEAAVSMALAKKREARFDTIRAFGNAIDGAAQAAGAAADQRPRGDVSYPRTMLHTGPPADIARTGPATPAHGRLGSGAIPSTHRTDSDAVQVALAARAAATGAARPDASGPATPAQTAVPGLPVSPAEQSPAEQSPAEQSPAEQLLAEQSPPKQSPPKQSPPKQSKRKSSSGLGITLVLLLFLGGCAAAAWYFVLGPGAGEETTLAIALAGDGGALANRGSSADDGKTAPSTAPPSTAPPGNSRDTPPGKTPPTKIPPLGALPADKVPDAPPPHSLRPKSKTFWDRIPRTVARAYKRRNYRRVLIVALRHLRRRPKDKNVLTVVGMAACQLHKMRLADRIFARMRGSRRRRIKAACRRKGIRME